MTRYAIRDAEENDARACAAIYAPYVIDTAVSFEAEPPTEREMARRIEYARRTHAWLVLVEEGRLGEGRIGGARVVGYAYGGEFKTRDAYRWSCEVSVYLDRSHRRSGGGRRLYEALFPRLAARGYRTVLAGMTLPNEASAGLHRELGFEPVGVYRRVGWKHGAWRDVAWVQRSIGEGTSDSGGPSSPPT